MIEAVRIVERRLARAIECLERARIQNLVIGDHAVSAWIASVDEAAVRNTFRVELLIERRLLKEASAAFLSAGFTQLDSTRFVETPDAKPRNAVELFCANELRRPDDVLPTPSLEPNALLGGFRVLDLQPLVEMQLVGFRTNDKVNVRDPIEVGLVDSTWLERLPQVLAMRLQLLLDSPEG